MEFLRTQILFLLLIGAWDAFAADFELQPHVAGWLKVSQTEEFTVYARPSTTRNERVVIRSFKLVAQTSDFQSSLTQRARELEGYRRPVYSNFGLHDYVDRDSTSSSARVK